MSFGSDMAMGFGAQIFFLLVMFFLAGAVVALGLYFGIDWIASHIKFVYKP